MATAQLSVTERFPSHRLFNMLNNMISIRPIDFRPAEAYNKNRIRGSIGIDIRDTYVAKEKIQSLVIQQRGLYSIVLVFDESTDNAALATLKDYIVSEHERANSAPSDDANGFIMKWRRLECIVTIDFEGFHRRYAACITVFDGAQNPPMPGYKGRNKYYASEIIPEFLYLGDYQNATAEDELRALQITHLVDATGAQLAKDVTAELGIQYLPINIWDCETADISAHFSESNSFISSAKAVGGRVLVHCRAGVSRSTSLVAAYMMSASAQDTAASIKAGPVDGSEATSDIVCQPTAGATLKDVISTIIKERPIIVPNSSFRAQLMKYEFELFGCNSLATNAEFLDLIHSESKLYSGDHATETDFDRMPIQALKVASRDAVWNWENAFSPPGTESYSTDELASTPAGTGTVAKKPFLKRNTARIVKHSASTIETAPATGDLTGHSAIEKERTVPAAHRVPFSKRTEFSGCGRSCGEEPEIVVLAPRK